VVFTHDTDATLIAAVALVNSAEPPDTLTTFAELTAFYDAHLFTGRAPADDRDLDALRALRAPLRQLLTSDRDTTAALVNEMLAQHRAVPRLVRHDHWDYHIHATDDTAPFAERIAVESAMAMLDVVRADELGRLAVCADDTCDGIVLDLSRNRSKRFCSIACGNRVAVAAYRARRS
jgi:predicted RNA-binding Zn ribbon-like protein